MYCGLNTCKLTFLTKVIPQQLYFIAVYFKNNLLGFRSKNQHGWVKSKATKLCPAQCCCVSLARAQTWYHLVLTGEGAALGLGIPCHNLSQGLVSLEVSLGVQAQLGSWQLWPVSLVKLQSHNTGFWASVWKTLGPLGWVWKCSLSSYRN